jgi:hypothetical protein
VPKGDHVVVFVVLQRFAGVVVVPKERSVGIERLEQLQAALSQRLVLDGTHRPRGKLGALRHVWVKVANGRPLELTVARCVNWHQAPGFLHATA